MPIVVYKGHKNGEIFCNRDQNLALATKFANVPFSGKYYQEVDSSVDWDLSDAFFIFSWYPVARALISSTDIPKATSTSQRWTSPLAKTGNIYREGSLSLSKLMQRLPLLPFPFEGPSSSLPESRSARCRNWPVFPRCWVLLQLRCHPFYKPHCCTELGCGCVTSEMMCIRCALVLHRWIPFRL